jgi:hypothetical protein
MLDDLPFTIEFEMVESRGKPSPRIPLTLSTMVTFESVTTPGFQEGKTQKQGFKKIC